MGDIILFRASRPGFIWHGYGLLIAGRIFDSTLYLDKDDEINRELFREVEIAIDARKGSVKLPNGITVRWVIFHPWDLPEGPLAESDIVGLLDNIPISTTAPPPVESDRERDREREREPF